MTACTHEVVHTWVSCATRSPRAKSSDVSTTTSGDASSNCHGRFILEQTGQVAFNETAQHESRLRSCGAEFRFVGEFARADAGELTIDLAKGRLVARRRDRAFESEVNARVFDRRQLRAADRHLDERDQRRDAALTHHLLVLLISASRAARAAIERIESRACCPAEFDDGACDRLGNDDPFAFRV